MGKYYKYGGVSKTKNKPISKYIYIYKIRSDLQEI